MNYAPPVLPAGALVASIVVVSPWFVPCGAATWHAPGDAETIQAGIELAQSGDLVLVAPGTYHETEIHMGSGVSVRGEGGSSVTILEPPAFGSGFLFEDLSELTQLEGMTIRGGSADEGGGIRISRSLVRLLDCHIEQCEASTGGGIYVEDSTVGIESSHVRDCQAEVVGGGIWFRQTTSGLNLTVVDTEITENQAQSGAGVGCVAFAATFERVTFAGNEATFGHGGGLIGIVSDLLITECVFVDNTAAVAGFGSALFLEASSGTVRGCTFVGNNRWKVEDPTIVFTLAEGIELRNSIVAFNDGRAMQGDGDVSVSCVCVFGNAGGDMIDGMDSGGNFSEDPLFCGPKAGDYTLDGESPCLPGQHPDDVDCGLIGALRQGCGATPVLGVTWGALKGSYR